MCRGFFTLLSFRFLFFLIFYRLSMFSLIFSLEVSLFLLSFLYFSDLLNELVDLKVFSPLLSWTGSGGWWNFGTACRNNKS